jgi:MOSC domain-containing protein YiiM
MSASAIDKRPASGPVFVGALGLEGDEQYERRFHGGPSKAVYAYGAEDLAWWSERLGRPLLPGFIGENVTTEGIDLNGLRAGDELHAGEVVLRVTGPRDPCTKLAARVGESDFVKRFGRAQRTGVYCAVERAGILVAGEAIVVERHGAGPTIRERVAAKYGREPDEDDMLGNGMPLP